MTKQTTSQDKLKELQHNVQPTPKPQVTKEEKCECHFQCGCDKGKCNCYSLTPTKPTEDKWEEKMEELLWNVYGAHSEPHSSSAVIKYAMDDIRSTINEVRRETLEECLKAIDKAYAEPIEGQLDYEGVWLDNENRIALQNFNGGVDNAKAKIKSLSSKKGEGV